jgi:hypothetical protein
LAPPHPHCVSAEKQRRRGFFRGYAQFGLPCFWAFVFAGRSHDAPSQRRDGRPPRGQRGFGAAGFFGLLSNLGIDRRNFRNPDLFARRLKLRQFGSV